MRLCFMRLCFIISLVIACDDEFWVEFKNKLIAFFDDEAEKDSFRPFFKEELPMGCRLGLHALYLFESWYSGEHINRAKSKFIDLSFDFSYFQIIETTWPVFKILKLFEANPNPYEDLFERLRSDYFVNVEKELVEASFGNLTRPDKETLKILEAYVSSRQRIQTLLNQNYREFDHLNFEVLDELQELWELSETVTKKTYDTTCIVKESEHCHHSDALIDMYKWPKITRRDTVRAFRQASTRHDKTILVQIRREFTRARVSIFAKRSSLLLTNFTKQELTCTKDLIHEVLKNHSIERSFEFVLNLADMPVVRRRSYLLPKNDEADTEAYLSSPVFSLATSIDFHDMLFPQLCRPPPEEYKFSTSLQEPKLVWRGTERGTINWSHDYSPSPRARYVERLQETDVADVKFVEDDLVDPNVFFRDPNFMSRTRISQFRYQLVIGGNGYPGDLHRKLNSDSLVFLHETPIHTVLEYGLHEDLHVVSVTHATVERKLKRWLKKEDEVDKMIERTSKHLRYMKTQELCYVQEIFNFLRQKQSEPPMDVGRDPVYEFVVDFGEDRVCEHYFD